MHSVRCYIHVIERTGRETDLVFGDVIYGQRAVRSHSREVKSNQDYERLNISMIDL